MKREVFKKRGQSTMSLPFGVIFSIILIVVFIVFAGIAINYFLGLKDCSSVGIFYSDFEKEINNALATSGTEKDFNINLPSKIKEVCFADLTKPAKGGNTEQYEEISIYEYTGSNVFILPTGEACDLPNYLVKNLDIEKITSQKNPYCVPAQGEIRIEKGIYDKAVNVR